MPDELPTSSVPEIEPRKVGGPPPLPIDHDVIERGGTYTARVVLNDGTPQDVDVTVKDLREIDGGRGGHIMTYEYTDPSLEVNQS